MDIVHLLPDSVANQIAAGEVVQRPASVVKELMENAIDAGAKHIQVVLKNVGKAIIQVIDDGKGMSNMDARMAFERHATSKIASAQDLFSINTLGFRGEALPSIASVSEVELKTRQEEDELGTSIFIAASELKNQESVSCPKGTNISVRNLFYNIPARRKFLKSDTTELRNITNEFLRVALTNPEISFCLSNNGNVIYNLSPSGLRQRIVNIFGKSINSRLINIDCATGLVDIKGFICSPEQARKTYGEQYFFVNNRFMKHPFFHKAVTEAYSGLIGVDCIPSYFIYFTVDPSLIDINIHPTKTEIKFQNETDFFQILLAGIKEALGKFNITPPLDFDTAGSIELIPTEKPAAPYVPRINYNPNYNPFNYSSSKLNPQSHSKQFSPGKSTGQLGYLIRRLKGKGGIDSDFDTGNDRKYQSGGTAYELLFPTERPVYRYAGTKRFDADRPEKSPRTHLIRKIYDDPEYAKGNGAEESVPGNTGVVGRRFYAGRRNSCRPGIFRVRIKCFR